MYLNICHWSESTPISNWSQRCMIHNWKVDVLGEKGLGSLIYSYEHCERNPTFPQALEFRQSDYLKYLRILNVKLIYGSNNHKFAIIPVKRWGGLGFKALLLKGQELYSFYCVLGSLSHTAPTPGHHFYSYSVYVHYYKWFFRSIQSQA